MNKSKILGIACSLALASIGALKADPTPAPSPADQGQCDATQKWHHHMHGEGRGPIGGMSCEKGGGPGACPMMRGDCHPFADALQLTDDQKQKVKAAMEAIKPQIQAIRQEEEAKIRDLVNGALTPILTDKQKAVLQDVKKLQSDKAALKTGDAAQQ